MHIVNLLEQLPQELLPFILKFLPIQDLKNCFGINNIWRDEVLREIRRRPRDEHLKYRLQKMYYRPGGYYRTAKKMRDACKKIGYKFTLAEVEDWLNKQFIYQIHKPPPKIIKNYINQSGKLNIDLGSDVTIIRYH